MRRINLIFLFIISFLLGSRNVAGQIQEADKSNLESIVVKWSAAHNDWDVALFKELYAQNVLFYCQQLPKNECIGKKTLLFSPDKIFHHKLVSEISFNQYPNRVIKASFIKKVTQGKRTKEYPSYLLLYKYQERFQIVGESDEITDKNLKFHLDINKVVLPGGNNMASVKTSTGNNNTLAYVCVSIFFGLVVFLLFLLFRKRLNKSSLELSPQPKTIEEETLNKVQIDPEDLNVLKGRKFEELIVQKFDPSYFKLLDWRGDKYVNGIYAKSTNDPDLVYEFAYNDFTRKFAVECKWRKSFYKNTVEFKESQFLKYKKFEQEHKMQVYLAIGIDGDPENPKELYLIPLSKVGSQRIDRRELSKHYKNTPNFFYHRDKLELS